MSRTLWFTGLSGSGKSTLAQSLALAMKTRGQACRIIDGDELRQGLCADLGFSRADRRENIRRAAELCRQLNQTGILTIGALISPYRDDRALARQVIGNGNFLEVWLAAPLTACERRDPKGLYRKAREGKIQRFTGIDDPYEAPLAPHLELASDRLGIADCVARLEALLGVEGNPAPDRRSGIIGGRDEQRSSHLRTPPVPA